MAGHFPEKKFGNLQYILPAARTTQNALPQARSSANSGTERILSSHKRTQHPDGAGCWTEEAGLERRAFRPDRIDVFVRCR
jgi:hypothetical protein